MKCSLIITLKLSSKLNLEHRSGWVEYIKLLVKCGFDHRKRQLKLRGKDVRVMKIKVSLRQILYHGISVIPFYSAKPQQVIKHPMNFLFLTSKQENCCDEEEDSGPGGKCMQFDNFLAGINIPNLLNVAGLWLTCSSMHDMVQRSLVS
jgi:hypothetical protein